MSAPPLHDLSLLPAWLATASREEMRRLLFSRNPRLLDLLAAHAPQEHLGPEEVRLLLGQGAYSLFLNPGLVAAREEEVTTWIQQALARDDSWNAQNAGLAALRALRQAGHEFPEAVLQGLREAVLQQKRGRGPARQGAYTLLALWEPVTKEMAEPLYRAIRGDHALVAMLVGHPAVQLPLLRRIAQGESLEQIVHALRSREEAWQDAEIRQLLLEQGSVYLYRLMVSDAQPGEFRQMARRLLKKEPRQLASLLQEVPTAQLQEMTPTDWLPLLEAEDAELRLRAQLLATQFATANRTAQGPKVSPAARER